jgi:hypothetical protein
MTIPPASGTLRHCRVFGLDQNTALPWKFHMNSPMHIVVETAAFTAQLGKLDVSASEREALYDVYSSNP